MIVVNNKPVSKMYYQKNGGTSADVVTRAYYNDKIVFENLSNDYPKNTFIFKTTKTSLIGKRYNINGSQYYINESHETFNNGVYTTIVSHSDLAITSFAKFCDYNGNSGFIGPFVEEIHFLNVDTLLLNNINEMFIRSYYLRTITGMESWDITNVTSATNIFKQCYNLCGTLDLSGWMPKDSLVFNYMFTTRSNNSIYCPSNGTDLIVYMDRFNGTQNFYGWNNGNNSNVRMYIRCNENTKAILSSQDSNSSNTVYEVI